MPEKYQDKILSVHIEKTAGTSFQEILETVFSREQVLIYNSKTGSFKRASEFSLPRTDPKSEFIKNTLGRYPFIWKRFYKLWTTLTTKSFQEDDLKIDTLPDNFKVIHGHFAADAFDQYLENPVIFTTFREPLNRMWSQYQHWRRNNGVPFWRADIEYDPEMTFEDYSMLPELQNYQIQALSTKDIHSLDVVGVTDNMPLFINTVLLHLQNRFPDNNHLTRDIKPKSLNRTRDGSPIVISEDFRESFRRQHSEDYKIYELVKERGVIEKY